MDIPFFKQDQINLEYINSIKHALESLSSGGHNMVLGQFSKTFEGQFASYLGSESFIYTANGLDSLVLALRALNLGPNDEVIVPCHTYIATWIAPLLIGCKLICVPVRNDNFLIDSQCLGNFITPKTKCIMPVHLYGNACDMNDILDFARSNNLFVVEDAAQAHGVSIENKKIGVFGDMTCFSFYPTKNLGAFGEAGGIATNNKSLARKLASMRNYGRSPLDGSENIYLSGNSRGDELQAAFLSKKLLNLEDIGRKRRFLVEIYRDLLLPVSDHFRLIPYQAGSSPHLAIGVLSDSSCREDLISFLSNRGIQASIHYKRPCHSQPCIEQSKVDIREDVKSQASDIASKIISLPMSECHNVSEIQYVSHSINHFFKSSR